MQGNSPCPSSFESLVAAAGHALHVPYSLYEVFGSLHLQPAAFDALRNDGTHSQPHTRDREDVPRWLLSLFLCVIRGKLVLKLLCETCRFAAKYELMVFFLREVSICGSVDKFCAPPSTRVTSTLALGFNALWASKIQNMVDTRSSKIFAPPAAE